MTEKEWVDKILAPEIREAVQGQKLDVGVGRRLPYAYQVRRYGDQELKKDDPPKRRDYQTDVLVSEETGQGWTPRLIIEAKMTEVTTHDAITYSQKAATQKSVHPHLRYGVLVGDRQRRPLPGLLLRHGTHFDFMMSWKEFKPSPDERKELIKLILDEVEISKKLEEIFFDSGKNDSKQYTFLHRPVILE